MKLWKKILVIFLTIVVLLFGFFMPKLVLQYSDARTESQVSRYELNDVSLSLSSQLWDRIATIRDGYHYSPLTLSADVDTEMTYEDVYQQMNKIDELFGQWVTKTGEISFDAEPKLLIGTNSSFSFIIWECWIMTEHSDAKIIIDDATGKMLSITSYWENTVNSAGAVSDVESVSDAESVTDVESVSTDSVSVELNQKLEEELNVLCEILKDYYGIPEAYVGENSENVRSSGTDLYDEYGVALELRVYITLRDEYGNEVDVPCYISDDGLISLNGLL